MFLLLILITAFITGQCQLDKGTWLVGGNGKLFSYKEDNNSYQGGRTYKYTQIDISASVGIFIIDKLAIGLRPTFSSIAGGYKAAGGGGITTNTQQYAFGPFARYYILKSDCLYNIVTDVMYQPGFAGGEHNRGTLTNYSAFAGPVIFFNSSVSAELLLGYNYTKEHMKTGMIDIRKGFQTSIGFQIHLKKY